MSPGERPVLAVVPTYLRTPADLEVTLQCLVSLEATAPEAEVLVVDDGSPAPELVDKLGLAAQALGIGFAPQASNGGFATAVNVGLHDALARGRDAILVNADIDFIDAGWVERMRARTDTRGEPAAIVGARLLYPNGLLQHAGVFFSLLRRDFFHRFQYGPSDLPEALVACRCPVTAALQLIRYETLAQVGVYDEGFGLGWEDVDYCLRTFQAGGESIYEPSVRAYHHESLFRGRRTPEIERRTNASFQRLMSKWAHADLTSFSPEVL